VLSCVVLAAGCSKPEKAADTAAAAAAAAPTPPPPAPIKLADVAGKWNVNTMSATADSVLATYVLDAKADSSGWTMTFPKGKPIPVHIVSMSGDSIVTHAGPFPSVLRKGVQVTADGVLRLQNGKLIGSTTSHYAVKTADSVAHFRGEGTRAP
jgi:hypothetical protein